MNIRTRHTYKPGGGRQSIEGPSQTIPGETRTIKDIVKRYRSTGELPRSREPQFLDVDDINQINKYRNPGQLDLTELAELRNHVKKLNDDLDKELTALEEAKAEEERKAAKEAEKQRLKEEIESEREETNE